MRTIDSGKVPKAMFPTSPTTTDGLTLDQVIDRLSKQAAVDGVLVMGSASTGMLNPASDLDLFVVMSDMPEPLQLVVTTIDARLSEVYFGTTAKIDRIQSLDRPTQGDADEAAILRWVEAGRIAFDRAGRLGRLRRKFESEAWLALTREGDGGLAEVYGSWWQINYNLRQTRRMLLSDDPVYQMAVDIRLLYCLPEALVGYMRARRLPWRGEKALIRHLQEHDAPFLDLVRQCIAETDRARKVDLLEQIAAAALALAGGLWPPRSTCAQVKADASFQPRQVEIALVFWDELVGLRHR